jgi:hypothetical protein
MESTYTFRADVLRDLLKSCIGIKTVRLCLQLERELSLPWASKLDTKKLPTGSKCDLLNAESHGINGRVCLRGSRWQGEVESRAVALAAAGPNPAALRLNDRSADCQTHAAALWHHSIER